LKVTQTGLPPVATPKEDIKMSAEVVLIAESIKLIAALFFQLQREAGKTEEEINASFEAIGEEAAAFNPDKLKDV